MNFIFFNKREILCCSNLLLSLFHQKISNIIEGSVIELSPKLLTIINEDMNQDVLGAGDVFLDLGSHNLTNKELEIFITIMQSARKDLVNAKDRKSVV